MNKNNIGFFKNTRRFISRIELEISYRLRLKHVPFLPTIIDIEPNNWCNFKCDHCQVTHWDKPKAQLDVQQFSDITEQFPNLSEVIVQGMGEPFLNKSTIEMLEFLDQKKIISSTTSNGSVLTENLAKRLGKLKHTTINFSLDGGTKQTFEGIRIKGNFEKVVDNIKSLIGTAPSLMVNFWVVVSQMNYKESEAIVNLADQIGVPKVTFQTFITDWGKSDMKERISKYSSDEPSVQDHLEKAMTTGKKKNITVKNYKGDSFTKKNPCKWPWRSMMIDASGNVLPCCVLADSDTMNFGNVFEQKVEKIWNSDKYKLFRETHAKGDIPDICKACYRQD